MLTKEQLEEYFKEDKTIWFKIDSLGQKKWNEEKVEEFWIRIRKHKIDNNEFDFSDYIFPKFETLRLTENKKPLERDRNFWRKGQNMEFSDEAVTFYNCVFIGFADFTYVRFHRSTTFMNAKFKDEVSFNFAKFYRLVGFNQSIFYSKGFFYSTIFKEVSFFQATFENEIIFIETDFQHSLFKHVNLGNKEILFEDIRVNEFPSLIFVDTRLRPNVVFRNCDMPPISFIKSDVNLATFSDCHWTNNNRIKLVSEKYINNNEIFRPLQEVITIQGLEETYRQLKRNFESTKNWELSGYAYVSEMEMRKDRLWQENKYLTWLIYWFYGFFGGYTQSFMTPLILLLISTVVFFPMIYLFADCNQFNFYVNNIRVPIFEINDDSVFCANSLRKSIDATFLFFKSTLKYKYWGIKYFQTIFNSILLTFIILALRKRFKQ